MLRLLAEVIQTPSDPTKTIIMPTNDVTEWDVYSSPDDDIHQVLIDGLTAALSGPTVPAIHSSQFGFTLADIADLFLKFAANPDSRFLFDSSQASGHAEAPVIANFRSQIHNPAQVAVGTSSVAHQILHTKAVTILFDDGRGWTFTGSWNASNSATEQFNIVDVVWSRSRAALFASRIDEMFNWVIQNEPQ